MRNFAVPLVCLVGLSHGRRVQTSAYIQQGRDELDESRSSAKSFYRELQVLKEKLLNFDPTAAAFSSSAVGVPSTWQKRHFATSRPVVSDSKELVQGLKEVQDASEMRAAVGLAMMADGVPTKLAEACSPEIEAIVEDEDSAIRMNEVLDWLPSMLMKLEVGEIMNMSNLGVKLEDDDMENQTYLDTDFVKKGKPWLHVQEYFGCSGAGLAEQLWSKISAAEYLSPGKRGGSMVLLLPKNMTLPDFNSVFDSFKADSLAEINAELEVEAFHPETKFNCPVPLIRVFYDQEELLIKDGSLSDAMKFL